MSARWPSSPTSAASDTARKVNWWAISLIGLRLLHEKLQRLPDFPPKLRDPGGAHDPQPSWRTGVRFSQSCRSFPKRLLLHHLDNLDSKMECMRALVAKDRLVEGCWTGYNASLERSVLKKAKYLEARSAPPAVPRTYPAPQPEPAGRIATPRPPTTTSHAAGALLPFCGKTGAGLA